MTRSPVRKPRIFREDGAWLVSVPSLRLQVYFATWRAAMDYVLSLRLAI